MYERERNTMRLRKKEYCAFVSKLMSCTPIKPPRSPWEIQSNIFSPFFLLMCLPNREEGENVLHKREEKENLSQPDLFPAYSALITAQQPFLLWDVQICLWLYFSPRSCSHKDSLDIFYASFLGGGVRD